MYEKHNWEPKETIASQLLNNIETGIENVSNDLTTHTEDADIHITQLDRDSWDKKLQSSDVADYQKLKVTNDSGQQIATAGGNKSLLQIVLDQKAGFRAISASPTTEDNPTNQALRGIALMNTTTSGNFIGMTEDGRLYSRAISGGQWVGEWQTGINTTNLPFLFRSTQVTNQDWNTIKTAGIFYVNAASGANKPNVSPYGFLEVITNQPAIVQRFTSIANYIVTRTYSPSTDTWSEWSRLLRNTDGLQMKPVTNSDGTAYFKAGDNDSILGKIVEIGAGVYNGEGTGKTSDSPNANNVRLIVNMVVSSAGSVIAVDSQGNLFTRAVSGSAWRGEWQPMISKIAYDELEKRISALEEKQNNI